MSTKPSPTTRAKRAKLAATLTNHDQLTAAVSRHVTLDLLITALELERDAELKAISEKYAAKIEPHIAERGDLFEQIEAYASKHRATLIPTDTKTALVAGHELQFRLGNPTVTTQKGTTQKAVLNALMELDDEEFADRFLRWKETLNKEAVLAAWPNVQDQIRLRQLGLEIDQVERLHLIPNLETATPTTSEGRPA
jgi:phage host-nuclease inhibitor protein Gam